MDKRKKHRSLILIFPIIGILAGLFFLLYPYVMDKYNDYKNSQVITSMSSVYDRYGENSEVIKEELKQAELYNQKLAGNETEGGTRVNEYDEQLTFDGNGIMGYLTIPSIDLKMIIYHGTSDDTLAIGAGHLEGSSLPVGGESTHAVLTAHSGMKNMKAFDNLRKLEVGDTFYVTVLGTEYWYMVDSIETVLPEETDSLEIVEGEDLMTLVTCTPYGINDHRLLVHGKRIEKPETTVETAGDTGTAGAENMDTESTYFSLGNLFTFDIWTAPLIILAVLCKVMIVVLVIKRVRRRKNK